MTYMELWRQLMPYYDENEAKAIVRILLEDGVDMTFTDIICGGLDHLTQAQQEDIGNRMMRLKLGEPVQYVTGCTWFANRCYTVTPDVLIPRPETEDLCMWIARDTKEESPDILDIGTGSGCIGITLSLDIPSSKVTAWDISEKALQIAHGNAIRLEAKMSTERQDALNPPSDSLKWDIIVSNPPYICDKEKKDMERNVLEHEPHTALFVPDDNPLLFYTAIARYAQHALRPNGRLYFEINPIYAERMFPMLQQFGFTDITTLEDRFGKMRFTRATRP